MPTTPSISVRFSRITKFLKTSVEPFVPQPHMVMADVSDMGYLTGSVTVFAHMEPDIDLAGILGAVVPVEQVLIRHGDLRVAEATTEPDKDGFAISLRVHLTPDQQDQALLLGAKIDTVPDVLPDDEDVVDDEADAPAPKAAR